MWVVSIEVHCVFAVGYLFKWHEDVFRKVQLSKFHTCQYCCDVGDIINTINAKLKIMVWELQETGYS